MGQCFNLKVINSSKSNTVNKSVDPKILKNKVFPNIDKINCLIKEQNRTKSVVSVVNSDNSGSFLEVHFEKPAMTFSPSELESYIMNRDLVHQVQPRVEPDSEEKITSPKVKIEDGEDEILLQMKTITDKIQEEVVFGTEVELDLGDIFEGILTEEVESVEEWEETPSVPSGEVLGIEPMRFENSIKIELPPQLYESKSFISAYEKDSEAREFDSIKSGDVVEFRNDEIIPRFEVPEILITDNGPCFFDNAVKDYCEQTKIKQEFPSIYQPQANPEKLIERTRVSYSPNFKFRKKKDNIK